MFSCVFLDIDIPRRLHLSFLRSFDCLLKRTLVRRLQISWVKGEDWGRARESESAETRRTEKPSLPLSLSCFTLVFSLAEPPPAPLGATWAAQRNTWRVTPVGGVMMEKAMRRGKHERMGGGGGKEWSRCWHMRGKKISNSIQLLFCKKFTSF